ncbi:DUF368 domain-containing protein [Candidatus Darwinibacter acetoxidans]|nr:DUF368 domain-containing protein [Bacillota bacterium]
MSKERGFWHLLGSGFILGLAMVIPGVSGGVLAMVLGLYEPIVGAIAKPFDNWRGHLRLLVPLGLGAGLCVLLLSRILQFLFAHYPVVTLYFFLGLVVAGLPSVFRLASAQGFGFSHALSCVLGAAVLLAVTRLPAAAQSSWENLGAMGFVFKGSIVGASLVVPGLSVSMLLLALGFYEELLGAVAHLDLKVLIPAGLGLVPGLVAASKVLHWLLARKISQVYSLILGLMLGSLGAAFPGLPRTGLEWLLCAVLFSGGVWIASLFIREE